MNDIEELQGVCDKVMATKEFQPDYPSPGVTHCNEGVQSVCAAFGYDGFKGLMANQICDVLAKDWEAVEGFTANKEANLGRLAIAAQKGSPHGHVSMVYPGAMVYSSKWKGDCPVLANVGERNGVMGANWAFADPPKYYVEKS